MNNPMPAQLSTPHYITPIMNTKIDIKSAMLDLGIGVLVTLGIAATSSRDTQSYGPPQQFYDQALVYYGAEGRFVTLGDYDTFDSSLRIMNPSLRLPTGDATATFGGDYRLARLASYVDKLSYGDGSLVVAPIDWVFC